LFAHLSEMLLRLKVLVPTHDLGAVISRLVPHFWKNPQKGEKLVSAFGS